MTNNSEREAFDPEDYAMQTYDSHEEQFAFVDGYNIARAKEAVGWMPIESAPKDGAPIDIWSTSNGRCTNMKWEQLSKDNGFFSPVSSGYSCVRDATHWQPLPKAPK